MKIRFSPIDVLMSQISRKDRSFAIQILSFMFKLLEGRDCITVPDAMNTNIACMRLQVRLYDADVGQAFIEVISGPRIRKPVSCCGRKKISLRLWDTAGRISEQNFRKRFMYRNDTILITFGIPDRNYMP